MKCERNDSFRLVGGYLRHQDIPRRRPSEGLDNVKAVRGKVKVEMYFPERTAP